MHKKLFRNDIILILVILVLAVTFFFVFSLTKKDGANVLITIDGDLTAEYPLDKDIELSLFADINSEYKNLLVIKNGEAYISEANCPDKICTQHRSISKTGETIVCLPHKLVVSIE